MYPYDEPKYNCADSKRQIKGDNNAKVYAIMMGFRQERNNKRKRFTMQICPIRRGPSVLPTSSSVSYPSPPALGIYFVL